MSSTPLTKKFNTRTVNTHGKVGRHSDSSVSSIEDTPRKFIKMNQDETQNSAVFVAESDKDSEPGNRNTLIDVNTANTMVQNAVKAAVAAAAAQFEKDMHQYVNAKFEICEVRINDMLIAQKNTNSAIEEKFGIINELNGIIPNLLNRINELELEVNHLAQYSRKSHIRVFGVVESKGENCVEIIKDIIKNRLGIQENMSIDVAHRVGYISKRQNDKPRGIIVRFVRRDHKQQVIQARRKLVGSPIVIAEDMTKRNVKFLNETYKHERLKKSWFTNGKIKAETHTGQIVELRVHNDVEKSINDALRALK